MDRSQLSLILSPGNIVRTDHFKTGSCVYVAVYALSISRQGFNPCFVLKLANEPVYQLTVHHPRLSVHVVILSLQTIDNGLTVTSAIMAATCDEIMESVIYNELLSDS